jgi:hypothetical protein
MKSIKQQYIDLREGNMTQANFMRNLRMTLPQYVTNVTSFEDSVRILKNKGILTEADTKSSEGKWKKVTGKDLYGHFKEIDNLNGHEVVQGIDWEMEKNHNLTKEEAIKIVIKNLKKNPIYYTSWDMSGIEGYEPEYMSKSTKPEWMQMKPVKGEDSLVDKNRGMKPVKDVEKIKKDADAKKETNSGVKGVSSMSLIAKAIRGLKKMNATGEKMKKVSVKENYEMFSSERNGEEMAAAAASESHNGLKRGNIVMIDSEVANKLGIEPDSKFEITGFVTYNAGKMLQSTDAILVDVELDENGKIIKRGTNKMDINVEYLEASLNENIFNKNSKITAGINKIAKGEDNDYVKNYNARAQAADAEQAKKDAEKNKKDTETQLNALKGNSTDTALASFPGLRERLKDMIRKELKEMGGAYGYGDAMDAEPEDGSSYINNNE